jgi:LEA14-like dessication related protein
MKRSLTLALLLAGICIALAVASLTFTGCSTIASALDLVNPTYSIRDIRPHVAIGLPLSTSSIDFDFNLGIDNPNKVGLRLDRVDFDLLVNQNRLLSSTTQQAVNIPARGFGEVPLRSRVGYNEIRGIWSTVVELIQGNRAQYQVNGTAFYNTPVGAVRWPVTVYTSR